jgi:hypothetical protein
METKNSIKKRMIATAAKAWGLSARDIERNDPIVPMLMDACANEIAGMDDAIKSNRDKMGAKIMELLTPEELTSPFPARAIMFAMPMSSSCDINEKDHFYFNKRNHINPEEPETEVFFTPTTNHKLVKGEIRYIAHNNNIKIKNDPLEKTQLFTATPGNHLEQDTLWLGIHTAKQLDSLDGISFYFNLTDASEYQEALFYNALQQTAWYIDETVIRVVNGYHDLSRNGSVTPTKVAREFIKSIQICEHVNSHYQKHYYSLIEEKDELHIKNDHPKYPHSFSPVFSDDDLKSLDGNLVWIKLSFDQHLSTGILEKINCSLNCFPVINRRIEKISISGKENIKSLIAEENEIFLGLREVSSDEKLDLKLSSEARVFDGKKSILTIRNDNIGRFNSRNALELIQQMIDVYREEFTAFSSFKSINQDVVENLNKAIQPFENVLDEEANKSIESMPYAMIKTPVEEQDKIVEISYWLTNGSYANNIVHEENFRFDSSELVRDKIFLVSQTFGGSNRKGKDELAHDFRYALLTRDRIVTHADVRAAAYKVFGNIIKNVEIENGYSAETTPYSGLQKTTVVKIKLITTHNQSSETIQFLTQDLKTYLLNKSINTTLFRVDVQ